MQAVTRWHSANAVKEICCFAVSSQCRDIRWLMKREVWRGECLSEMSSLVSLCQSQMRTAAPTWRLVNTSWSSFVGDKTPFYITKGAVRVAANLSAQHNIHFSLRDSQERSNLSTAGKEFSFLVKVNESFLPTKMTSWLQPHRLYSLQYFPIRLYLCGECNLSFIASVLCPEALFPNLWRCKN